MASNGTTGLLPGQSAPFTTITSTDHSGIVLIATAVGLAFALVSILIRVYIQLGLRTAADMAVISSIIFYVFQATATFLGTSNGYGKTIEDIPVNQLVSMQKAIYSSEILYIITVWLTKCSVAFLFIRLSPDKRHNIASYTVLGMATIFMFISVLIIGLRCDLSEPWIFLDAKCPHVFARWQTVAGMDIITELALFATSIYLVKNLQLSLQKKSLVVMAFGLRLPMIAPIVLRLDSILETLHSTDPTLKGSMSLVYTQVELCCAIIAATTPCLRPFMKALSTHYGAPASMKSTPNNTHGYSLNSVSKRSKVAGAVLSNLGKKNNGSDDMPPLRWDKSAHHASVTRGDDQQSIQSHESKQMIISKNTQWTVDFGGEQGKDV